MLCDNLEGLVRGGRLKRERIHVHLWLIHTVAQQKPTQHCKAIILQLKKKTKLNDAHHHRALGIMLTGLQFSWIIWSGPGPLVLGLVQVCHKCVCSGVQADGVLVIWGMLISCRSSWQEPSQILQAYSPYPPMLHGPSKPDKPNTKSSGTRGNIC